MARAGPAQAGAAGQFQAITGRLDEIAARLAELSRHVEQVTAAEAILRRAHYEPPLPPPVPG